MRIELTNLCKQFEDGQKVLDSLNYSEDIRSLAVIGPSGGGKSTLLRILDGLIPATAGEVTIDGKLLGSSDAELLAHRRNIGFVFQAKGLFSHLTGKENIVMPLIHAQGYSKTDAIARANTLLERFSLRADAHKYVHELSGGQQQRIAIARAIASKPNLLLLDEPTSALDPELTNEVLDMINELRSDNLSIIVVTHEMGFAKKACDKLLFLVNGRLVEQGSSKELFAKPKTAELKGFLDKILQWDA